MLHFTISAAVILCALKIIGLTTQGGYVLLFPSQAHAQEKDAAQGPVSTESQGTTGTKANREDKRPADTESGKAQVEKGSADDTANTANTGPDNNSPDNDSGSEPDEAAGKEAGGAGAASGMVVQRPLEESLKVSESERAILQRLQERRRSLELQAKEIEFDETLLQALERRLDAHLATLPTSGQANAQKNGTTPSANPAKSQGASGQSLSGASARQDLEQLARVFSAMKPVEAARLFNNLDIGLLRDLSKIMKADVLGPIMAQMEENAAKRLTHAIAFEQGTNPAALPPSSHALPKIIGRPE